MKTKKTTASRFTKVISLFALSLTVAAGLFTAGPAVVNPVFGSAQAACLNSAPPTTYGQVTQTVNITTAGTYRVWSRIKAPSTSANSYYFQADGGCAYNVGDSTAIPTNTWTWVNYQDGAASSTIGVTLAAGNHTLTYTGKEADVQLDKVMLLTDTGCTPSGFGDNCAVNDTTSPTVSVTAPTTGATVSGTVNVTANAADASGVSKVDFLVDGAVVATDTSSAYSYSWNTAAATNATHTIQAKATDNAGNTASSAVVSVTVKNTVADTTKPVVSLTAPANGASAVIGATVNATATASDNVGVAKVEFLVDGTVKATDTATPYAYAWPTAGVAAGAHSITAKAYDAAGNVTTSTAVSVSLTAPATNGTKGDVNGDGRVNAIDLSFLISHDGQNYPAADFNKDGTVGAADLAIMLANWTF